MSTPDPVVHGGTARGSSVRFRVVVFAVVMVLLMLGIAWPATVAADRQDRLVHRLTVLVGPAVDASLQVRAAAGAARAATDRQALDRALLDAQTAMQTIDRIVDAPEADVEATVPADQLRRLQEDQRRDLEGYLEWSRSLPQGTIPASETAESQRLYQRLEISNQALTDALRDDRSALRATTLAGGERTMQIVIVTTGIALLIALFATWWTLHSLTGPILALRDTVRRQRAGHRSEWARVDRGASEVRQLAADVNALTASHLALMDDQAMRLVFERAIRDLTRSLRDTSSIETALFLVVENVAENLGAAHVVAITRAREGQKAQVQHYVTDGHSDCIQGDRVMREAVAAVGGRLWTTDDRFLRIDDLDSASAKEALAPYLEPERTADLSGSLLVVPVGVQDRTIGTLLVHEDEPRRQWRDAELAFVDSVADALARYVVSEEVESGREDYVRRLEELDRQKDTFLSTVSHELRTPLTSISGYLEMLQDGDAGELQPSQLAMLDVIERNAARLRRLIEDLLVLNRIQNAASTSTRELVDMAEIVDATVAEFRAAADKQGVTMRSSAEPDAFVFGDRGNLSRAVANIVANAVKFTPPGGDIDLEAAVDAQTRVVRIVCTDTGMGIPDEEFPRISERFFRASNAATAQIPGTGLGLAIVRGIVESHGGRLTFCSTENAGTTVSMALPGPPQA